MVAPNADPDERYVGIRDPSVNAADKLQLEVIAWRYGAHDLVVGTYVWNLTNAPLRVETGSSSSYSLEFQNSSGASLELYRLRSHGSGAFNPRYYATIPEGDCSGSRFLFKDYYKGARPGVMVRCSAYPQGPDGLRVISDWAHVPP